MPTVSEGLARIVLLPAGLIAASSSAIGQTTSQELPPGLSEVVVTAERREERLQDVPVSVSVLSREDIDAQGLRSIDDIGRLTPGLTFQRNGASSSSSFNDEQTDINIRGIDSTAGTATTAIYIDDTPIQGRHLGFQPVQAFPALFDLDRVEVLRGPQGTLFGASAEGGAVRFITPQPSLQTDSGYALAEFGSTQYGDPSYELGAAAGGPIVDGTLGFRLSASARYDGGWVDRVTYTLSPNPSDPELPTPIFSKTDQEAANWQRTETLRGALTWAAADNVLITPSIYYQELRLNDTSAYWLNLSNPRDGQFFNGNALTSPSVDPFLLTSIKLDWNLGSAQLTSNTAYFHRHQSSSVDYTQYDRETYAGFGELATSYPNPGDGAYSYFEDDQANFYQEVRLTSSDPSARADWNVGIYYSHLDENVPQVSIVDPTLRSEVLQYTTEQGSPTDICAPPLACPNGEIFFNPTDRMVDRQAAVFAELAYKITRTLKLTAGLRFSDVSYTGSIYEGGAFFGLPSEVSRASASQKPLTPKVILAWQPDHDDLYYASAAKGYRIGGVNVGIGTICNQDLAALGLPVGPDGQRAVPSSYQSDSLWSYELGVKKSFFDHRLQVDSSVFLIDWNNIQQNIYLPNCGEQFTANLGQVQSRGGEVSIQFRATHALEILLSSSYTDARFTRTSCAGALIFNGSGCGSASSGLLPVVSEGDRLLGAPWTVVASTEYVFPNWKDRSPYIRLDYQLTTAQTGLLPYQDSRNALNDPTLPGLPDTRNLNARGGLRWDGYDVSAFVNNATNEQPLMLVSRDIAGPIDNNYFARGVRPRTVGITATYRY